MNVILLAGLFCIIAAWVVFASRNRWVYLQRAKLNRFDGDVHAITQYVDYDDMMKKFWVWDIEKLRLRNPGDADTGGKIKRRNGYPLWFIGQIASTLIGVVVGMRHGAEVGVAVGYALLVLVDIRRQTARVGVQ